MKRVLIADDAAFMRLSLKTALEKFDVKLSKDEMAIKALGDQTMLGVEAETSPRALIIPEYVTWCRHGRISPRLFQGMLHF